MAYSSSCQKVDASDITTLPDSGQAQITIMPDVAPGLWERILEALHVENASQAARKLGLAKQSVYEWKGGKVPGLVTLIQIAESGNTSLDWLILNKEEEGAVGALEGNSKAIIEKLALAAGHSFTETLNVLVRESLAKRGAALFERYPNLDPEDIEQMRTLLSLFEEESNPNAAAQLSRKRG
jgi:transcriptional regulator with XRE-family HTH domain